MIPTFPFEPRIGQYVFFRASHVPDPYQVSLYGKIKRRTGERWLVDLKNSTSSISFDPVTGIANPFCQQHILCWVSDDKEYDRLNYNDAMIRASEEMKEHGNQKSHSA